MDGSPLLPYVTEGKVIKGFGRGGKELGCPTANFPEEVVNKLPEEFKTGIYYGLSKIDNGPVLKMVMSIGYNPFYNNEKRSMETHVLHKFEADFYDAHMKVCIIGWLRPEESYTSLEDLVAAIEKDIADADKTLTQEMINVHLRYFD